MVVPSSIATMLRRPKYANIKVPLALWALVMFGALSASHRKAR